MMPVITATTILPPTSDGLAQFLYLLGDVVEVDERRLAEVRRLGHGAQHLVRLLLRVDVMPTHVLRDDVLQQVL